jgi:hypothetical protein
MRWSHRLTAIALALGLAVGCSSSSGPVIEGDRFVLVSVDGAGLPFVVATQNTAQGVLETSVFESDLTLKPDSTIRLNVQFRTELGGSTSEMRTAFGGEYRIQGDTLLRVCVNCSFSQGDEVYTADYTVGGFTLPKLYPSSPTADYRFARQ